MLNRRNGFIETLHPVTQIPQAINQTPILVIIFYPDKQHPFERDFPIFKGIQEKYKNSISFVKCDSSLNVNYSFVDTDITHGLIIFQRGKHMGTYLGRWTETNLEKLCNYIISPSSAIFLLNSARTYKNFINAHQFSVVIFGPSEDPVAESYITEVQKINIIIPIGRVTDRTVQEKIGVTGPMIRIVRTIDDIILDITDVSQLRHRLKSFIRQASYEEDFGASRLNKWVLGAVVTTESNSAISLVAEVFKNCAALFRQTVSYHLCYDTVCTDLARLSGILNQTCYPAFFAFKDTVPILYRGSDFSKERIRIWFKRVQKDYQLDPHSFLHHKYVSVYNWNSFLNPNKPKTVVLLLGDPITDGYKEAFDLLAHIAQVKAKNNSLTFQTFNNYVSTKKQIPIPGLKYKNFAYAVISKNGKVASRVFKKDPYSALTELCQETHIPISMMDKGL